MQIPAFTPVVAAGFLALAACLPVAWSAAPPDDATAFGAMPTAFSVALSADGKRLVYVGPGTGANTIAVVIDLAAGSVQQIAAADGNPMNLGYCDWSALDRLVCSLHGISPLNSQLLGFSRMLAMDADGKNQLKLGQQNTAEQLQVRQFDGFIVDWLNGLDGTVLMSRSNLQEQSTGHLASRTEEGLGVDRIDTRTGKATSVEHPGISAENYISDGLGNVRLMTSVTADLQGFLRGVNTHLYRLVNDRNWHKLGTDKANDHSDDFEPLAVDPIINAAYVLERLDGRLALYRYTLDESLKRELVFASKEVDIDGVVTIGRAGRVIGASYTTDRPHTVYFDPAYLGVVATLAKALPKLPLIDFASASADEQVLLVHASSDVDPGHYYVYDRTKKSLLEVIVSYPALKGKTLSPVRPVTYKAADGTQIPGYLTLPPGVTDAKNLPAIVMPHGGPSARDSWGFDWLSQYFAQRGYAVLQPNFRGSSGYGDKWFVDNGFKNWKISIGDVCDGGRWLVSQGIADPSKLAIVGWSYGGYAALQANVVDPDLFKAVVAVAPVTDLALMKAQAAAFTSSQIVQEFIGSGPHVVEGSPAQNASVFKAPVLMFQGDMDINVDIAQPKKMDKALRDAHKSSELVIYPKLEHSLRDSTVRADLLRRADAFLRARLKL